MLDHSNGLPRKACGFRARFYNLGPIGMLITLRQDSGMVGLERTFPFFELKESTEQVKCPSW